MNDVTGADEGRKKDESPIYHVSILSVGIIAADGVAAALRLSVVLW